jgi:outer membrane protein TolC
VASLADWSGGSLAALAEEQRGRPRAQTEEWWRNFDDPVLDALVAEAQRVNPNVRTAGMRIMEARAQLAIAGSLLYPQQQQVTGKVMRMGTEASSGPDTVLTAYNIGFGVGWEIDFWGKFRRSIEAADAGYFASIAQYADVQVLIAAQTASFYAAIARWNCG